MFRFDSEDWNDQERAQTSPYASEIEVIALEQILFAARQRLRDSRRHISTSRKQQALDSLTNYVDGCALLVEGMLRVKRLTQELPPMKKPEALFTNHPDNVRRRWFSKLADLSSGLFHHYRVRQAFDGNPFIDENDSTWVRFQLSVSKPKEMLDFIEEHAEEWNSQYSTWKEQSEYI